VHSTKGRLLVATPLLGDPNFERTVVLMLEHTEDGALGIVLNRPSPLPVDDPLPDWSRFVPEPAVVFVGGPVARGSVIAIARPVEQPEHPLPDGAWEPVIDGVGVLDLGLDDVEVGPALSAVRVFTGYAGWGDRQLEAEIAEGAWWIVDADPADALTVEPGQLWREVLRRQPPPLNHYAFYPDDINAN
jgi:putative transcriptional regulator